MLHDNKSDPVDDWLKSMYANIPNRRVTRQKELPIGLIVASSLSITATLMYGLLQLIT